MEKIKKIFNNPLFTFILGVVFCSGIVYAANSFGASEIPYTSNGQSTVEGAINDLYTRANTWINPANMINSKSITSNGTYDITNYKSASVNVPNSNSATYTPTTNGTALDMGATNTYRYVNTSTVYNKGKEAGANEIRVEWADPTTIVSNSKGNIFAYERGMFFSVNGTTHLFKWSDDSNTTHMKQLFSNNCTMNDDNDFGEWWYSCSNSTFECTYGSDGGIYCNDKASNKGCDVSLMSFSCW